MSAGPDETLIYIRERGASPDRWCPARAAAVSGDVYRVIGIPADPPLEFQIGDLVRCAQRAFPDGSEALLAIGRAAP